MRRQLAALLFAGAFVVSGGTAMAHTPSACSIKTIRLSWSHGAGVQFTSRTPSSSCRSRGADGADVVWNLEGGARADWSATLDGQDAEARDQLTLRRPAAQRAPGGAWNPSKSKIQGRKPDPGHPLICGRGLIDSPASAACCQMAGRAAARLTVTVASRLGHIFVVSGKSDSEGPCDRRTRWRARRAIQICATNAGRPERAWSPARKAPPRWPMAGLL